MAKGKIAKRAARQRAAPGGFGRFVRRAFLTLVIVFVALPIALIAIYRFVPVPGTILMVQRAVEGKGWDYRWRPLSKISPNLVNAVIAAEDSKFCEHRGFDVEAIEKALKNNQKGRRVRGGSTISQQTAKNVFLWPHRDWVRKGLETYLTPMIEFGWGKRRIMEIYLNVAELGPGVYGAEAAARHYYKTSAANLTPAQASRLAAILPSPQRYQPVASGPYVRRQSRTIGGRAAVVRRGGMSACVLG